MSEYRNQKSLLRDVEHALWYEWDPIGLKEMGERGPTTEYDSYAPAVLGVLNRGGDDRALALHLLKLEREQMEMHDSTIALLEAVAARIRARLAWKAPSAAT